MSIGRSARSFARGRPNARDRSPLHQCPAPRPRPAHMAGNPSEHEAIHFGELRILAHSAAQAKRACNRTTIGDRSIVPANDLRVAADESVLNIDASPIAAGRILEWSGPHSSCNALKLRARDKGSSFFRSPYADSRARRSGGSNGGNLVGIRDPAAGRGYGLPRRNTAHSRLLVECAFCARWPCVRWPTILGAYSPSGAPRRR